MGATKVWTGFVNFGLLSIPCFMHVAAREKRVDMGNFHKDCKMRVNAPKVCRTCTPDSNELRELTKVDMFRGYEKGGQIIPITDEELDGITPKTGKVMEISECVDWAEVDPIYLAESFYLMPEDAGRKAYSLLVRTLKESGRVAVAQVTKNGREHVAFLRPKGNGLMLHYAWYADEIAEVAEFEKLPLVDVSAAEIKLANQLVQSMTGEFEPTKFEDGYRQRLNTLIASKIDSSVEAPKPVSVVTKPSVDIAAALTASLAAGKAKPKKAEPVAKAPAKRKGKAA